MINFRTANHLLTLTISFALFLATTHNGSADIVAFDLFNDVDTTINNHGNIEQNGWASSWSSKSLRLRNNKLFGQGTTSRRLICQVDFDLDAQWFFKINMKRSGASGPSSFCAFRLTNKDRKVDRIPMIIGINSTGRYYATAGSPQNQVVQFGKYQQDQNITFIARLITRRNQKDELAVWVFPANSRLPHSLNAKPHMRKQFDYSNKSNALELATGNAQKLAATFDNLIIGEIWQDMLQANPKPFTFKHKYKKFKQLTVTNNSTHPLHNLWGNTSLIKWDDQNWQVYHSTYSSSWTPRTKILYTQASPDQISKAKPMPDYNAPTFDSGRPFNKLRDARYQMIVRPDGKHDMIELSTLKYLPITTPQPDAEKMYAGSYDTLTQSLPKDVLSKFIGDIDGDNINDLILCRRRDIKWKYWVESASPWRRNRQPMMGPDRDPIVNENIRGYDIQGNWLGSRITYEILWAKGSRTNNKLSFGKIKPIYQGRDDFPLQWRNFAASISAAVLNHNNKRYLIIASAVDKVLAAPILDTNDHQIHVGRSISLISPNSKPYTLNQDQIYAVVDIDNDNHDDVILGSGGSGFITVLKGNTVGQFTAHPLQMIGGPITAATLATPTLGDWTNDGKDDLIIGDGQGLFTLYPGTDNPLIFNGCITLKNTNNKIIRHTGTRNIQGPQEIGWGYTKPQMFDWDNDGQLDLITNDNTATFKLFKRTSTNNPAIVDDTKIFTTNGHKLPVAWRSRPTVIPGKYRIAGDNRPVLLYLDIDQNITFGIPESIGNTNMIKTFHPTYTDGSTIQTAWYGGLSGRTSFSVIDWDQDGKWDILFDAQGENTTRFYKKSIDMKQWGYLKTHSPFWLRNVGTNNQPIFEKARRIRHADGSIMRTEIHGLNVCPADLDKDGQALDLVFGDGPGSLFYVMRDELSWDEEPSP
ncbi:FG-GAP repeat domain-containing protein [Poriferisphaera sp. WC338]|uniref:FG-GAP repeat domain-containing protein n=1 Tax=Poriferisphaera sp. WC338 TaxID=3425129 RepID=UPI003D8198ED